MATDTVTPIRPPETPSLADSIVLPLVHARPTLDLIRTMASEGQEGLIECMRPASLADAVDSAMARIDAAIEAAERLALEQVPPAVRAALQADEVQP
jgi:hypothetical protein